MKRRTVALPAIIAASTAAWSAVGGPDYESVPDLVKALRGAGIACPVFTEVEPPSRSSAGHGSCWTADNASLFSMDVYGSEKDREEGIASWSEAPVPYCIAFGQQWSVNLLAMPTTPTVQRLLTDSTVKCSGAGVRDVTEGEVAVPRRHQ